MRHHRVGVDREVNAVQLHQELSGTAIALIGVTYSTDGTVVVYYESDEADVERVKALIEDAVARHTPAPVDPLDSVPSSKEIDAVAFAQLQESVQALSARVAALEARVGSVSDVK